MNLLVKINHKKKHVKKMKERLQGIISENIYSSTFIIDQSLPSIIILPHPELRYWLPYPAVYQSPLNDRYEWR